MTAKNTEKKSSAKSNNIQKFKENVYNTSTSRYNQSSSIDPPITINNKHRLIAKSAKYSPTRSFVTDTSVSQVSAMTATTTTMSTNQTNIDSNDAKHNSKQSATQSCGLAETNGDEQPVKENIQIWKENVELKTTHNNATFNTSEYKLDKRLLDDQNKTNEILHNVKNKINLKSDTPNASSAHCYISINCKIRSELKNKYKFHLKADPNLKLSLEKYSTLTSLIDAPAKCNCGSCEQSIPIAQPNECNQNGGIQLIGDRQNDATFDPWIKQNPTKHRESVETNASAHSQNNHNNSNKNSTRSNSKVNSNTANALGQGDFVESQRIRYRRDKSNKIPIPSQSMENVPLNVMETVNEKHSNHYRADIELTHGTKSIQNAMDKPLHRLNSFSKSVDGIFDLTNNSKLNALSAIKCNKNNSEPLESFKNELEECAIDSTSNSCATQMASSSNDSYLNIPDTHTKSNQTNCIAQQTNDIDCTLEQENNASLSVDTIGNKLTSHAFQTYDEIQENLEDKNILGKNLTHTTTNKPQHLIGGN